MPSETYQGHGRQNSDNVPSPASDRSSNATGNARLMSDGRYVNNHLWSAISGNGQAASGSPVTSPSELGGPKSLGDQSGSANYEEPARSGSDVSPGRSFLFGAAGSSPGSLVQFPANHTIYLWQIYLTNIDPVMKISHTSIVQQIFLGQIGRPNIPQNEQALIASIYLVSTVSLTDEQCHNSLQSSKTTLIQTFREATESCLSAAGFITTTDIIVLQALILYLAALRSLGEIQTVWSMFGLATRIAGTIGLARDGTHFDLSPFEIEMRRRLWWALVYFDGRMAELVGQDGDLMGNNFDARPPANYNDVDLFPSMKHLPEPRIGPTEAIYLQARVLCLTSARSLQNNSGIVGTWERLREGPRTTAEKMKIMDNVQRKFRDEIISPCDKTVPLQWLSINTARTFMAKLRLVSRIPIVNLDQEWESSDGYSENAFIISMELMQHQLDLWCEPNVQHWRWHWSAHFQWYALACLLRQTRLRYPGTETSQAWGLIKRVFETIIPSLELGPRKSLLLDGIHTLLSAAKNNQVQTAKPAGSAGELFPLTYSTSLSPPSMLATRFGARPHNALLPGMDRSPISPSAAFGQFNPENNDYSNLEFDLEAIDWAEFDRLAAELCQQ